MAVRVGEPCFACGDWYAYHGSGGKLLCSVCASPAVCPVCERHPELVADRLCCAPATMSLNWSFD